MSEHKRQSPLPDLTPRQLQILKLLQAGKPNKELSEELGIGVGTVKQHLVALFKKLNVRNRAMAVSLAADIQQQSAAPTMSLKREVLLDRRPCVVLSMSLPHDATIQNVRLMHGRLGAFAAAHDAIFLARSGNAGDVIFGIQHTSEYVVAVALHTARTVLHDLMLEDVGIAAQLRGCLTAGHAFASMHQFGGWTGEALASTTISSARTLLDTISPGQFLIDEAARDLTALFGIEGLPNDVEGIPFFDLDKFRWSANRLGYELIDRVAEMSALRASLNASAHQLGNIFHIEGEMGMGKSRLCEEVYRLCQDSVGVASFYRCLPAALNEPCWSVTKEEYCDVDEIDARLRNQPVEHPDLVIVDDIHLLPAEQQTKLIRAVEIALKQGKLVVLAGRKIMHIPDTSAAQIITLRRMSPQSLQGLVRKVIGKAVVKDRTNKVLSICSAAAGVPLFAIELARHHQEESHLPLSLQFAINARLDGLHLDRWLLREVARQAAGISIEDIRQKMGEEATEVKRKVNNSIAAGVLSCSADEWISFTHPLLRLAINDTITD